MKKTTLLLLFILFSTSQLFAQAFISAVSEFQPSNDCIMELIDGTIVEGKVASATLINENISSMTLKDADGIKHKHKAAEIKRFQVKMGFLAKMDAAAEGSSSIAEMTKTDFNEIVNREYIIYQQALLPKKKDKYRLLQLVNPGFDSKIQVFDNPKGKETGGLGVGGVQITGGKEKSYLVVVDNKKSLKWKKEVIRRILWKFFQGVINLCKL